MKNKYSGRKIDNINDIKDFIIRELEKRVNMNVGEEKEEKNGFNSGSSFIEEVISLLRRFNDEEFTKWVNNMNDAFNNVNSGDENGGVRGKGEKKNVREESV